MGVRSKQSWNFRRGMTTVGDITCFSKFNNNMIYLFTAIELMNKALVDLIMAFKKALNLIF